MAKIMLELEKQDARIVAVCLGLAVYTISSPEELFSSLFKPRHRKIIVSLLGLMGGMQRQSELSDKVSSDDPTAFDESTVEMANKARQLAKLMRAILHQTDPDQISSPV